MAWKMLLMEIELRNREIMKFHALKQEREDALLKQEHSGARIIGNLRIGESVLFFRSGLKTYYVPFADVKRCFRRVLAVPMKMCCENGELEVENLVIGDSDRELAQITLPGSRAAREVIRILKEKMPDADFSAPGRTAGEAP